MKRHSGLGVGRATVVALAALTLTAMGCATYPSRDPAPPEPVVCADPVLVELRAEHPDSLSEREWQRYQVLERRCDVARAETAQEPRYWTHDHHVWWMGSGLVMTAMMLAMWSPW